MIAYPKLKLLATGHTHGDEGTITVDAGVWATTLSALARSERVIRMSASIKKVTRFEVINHRTHGDPGRTYVAYDVDVELSYQDDGRTLKVFLTDRAALNRTGDA